MTSSFKLKAVIKLQSHAGNHSGYVWAFKTANQMELISNNLKSLISSVSVKTDLCLDKVRITVS